ncbi:MAG: FUSC family protein, partial [Ectothiorhodospiraceae bacterium]
MSVPGVSRILVSGADRIALLGALRGTFAALVPFVVLSSLGHVDYALFTTIAALNVSIADSGGAYRERLAVMSAVALVVPVLLIAGMQVSGVWWLATPAMFLVAMLGGLGRLWGAPGTALGLIGSIVFLIGVEIPGGFLQSLQYAGFYLLGAFWTVLLSLLIWRVRPYRRVRYEIGESFRLLALMARDMRHAVSVSGSRMEQDSRLAQARVREAITRARQGLGETVTASRALSQTVSDLVVLLRAASRINASLGGLAGAMARQSPRRDYDSGPAVRPDRTLVAIERDCRSVATVLLEKPHRGDVVVEPDSEPEAFSASSDGSTNGPGEVKTLVDVIARYLNSAAHAAERLVAGESAAGRILPPLHGPAFPAVSRSTVVANFSLQSLVFAHALRVATVSALGMAAFLLLAIPHSVWIPLTTLIILQPNVGATVTRALHRTAGTVLGSLLAGAIVFLFPTAAALQVSIIGCLFLTLLFFRRHYWLAVVFLTPLIILLLTIMVQHPWTTIVERVANTLAGAALALTAGHLLWPRWEFRRFPEEVAAAVDANKQYLTELIDAAGHGTEANWPLAGARAHAELATSNARASLERMLTESREFDERARRALRMVTHVERLTRHVTRLSIYLHERPGAVVPFGELSSRLQEDLEELAIAVAKDRSVSGEASLESAYAKTRQE